MVNCICTTSNTRKGLIIMKHFAKIFSAIFLACTLALTGCTSKQGNLESSQTNTNQTVVYTSIGIQDTKYTIADAIPNNFMGKHTYYYETKSDGKTLKKLVYIWEINQDVTRHILEVNQPDAVSESSMNNLYNFIDEEMTNDYAVWSCSDETGTKTPNYMTLLKGKSDSGNKSTLTVVIDLTDKSLDLTEKNIQYGALSDFLLPRLYDKKTHSYQITEKRLKKYMNDTSNKRANYLEISMPIFTKGYWKVTKKSVDKSDLKSEQIKEKIKQAKDNSK